MRFMAQFDLREDDCSFCPFFERMSNDSAICKYSEMLGEPEGMGGIMVPDGRGGATMHFPMPVDCPLVPCIG